MEGILNIDKPRDETSFRTVSRIKRLTGAKRAGHAGTLDPAATGVLPICLGQATRVVEYLMDATKTYRARLELGATSDTYDATGDVIRQPVPGDITREAAEAALDPFRGAIRQTPPMFSAVKHQGQPLYRLARAGIEVPRRTRAVRIDRLEIAEWQPPLLTIEVDCSKGTYIRSLAHDFGQALGCGAILADLVRLRCGIFRIEDALSPDEVAEACLRGDLPSRLYPADSVLQSWRAVSVSEETAAALQKGQSVSLPETSPPSGDEPPFLRAYHPAGFFLAVLSHVPGTETWHPVKVFHPPETVGECGPE
ncbi:MAG: tRNA pseudouridine(55) synthase TruB [Chloroflexota bacterium]